MKNLWLFVAFTATVLGNSISYSQKIAGFDDLILDTNSYWIGSNQGPNDFISGFTHFSHFYDSAYYTWNGFAYSNLQDTTTQGWANQYACRPGTGAENTSNYGVFYQWAKDSIWFDSTLVLDGIYITNSTYAALSMQFGDAYSKKFGGDSGNDPDWFLLTINGYDEFGISTGVIEFYLADYRFENNEEDFIVTDWKWVDLTDLGEVKTVKFNLSSSDNGDWGMNTPAYFCLDELKSNDYSKVISFNKNNFEINVYPNPFSEIIFIESEEKGEIQVSNINGQVVFSRIIENSKEHIYLRSLEKGIYFISIIPSADDWNRKGIETRKIIKK